jgi:uncharacterized protein YjeT (DUF2065 family)
MWRDFGAALALVMVIEGLLPFLSPARCRESLLRAARLPDATLRTLGLASMLAGLLLLYYVRS